MQYVSVTGNDHAEALKKLRERYGPDAIIYNEKMVEPKSVISKMVGKKQFKIEAAIREKKAGRPRRTLRSELSEEAPSKEEEARASLISRSISGSANPAEPSGGSPGHLNDEQISMLNMIQKNHKPAPKAPKASNSLDDLKPNEVEFLRRFIAEMAVPSEKAVNLYAPEFKTLYRILEKQDFTHQFVDSVLQSLYNQLPKDQWKVFPLLYKKAADILCDKIKTSSVFHKRAVAFIGPTGVGKTSMVAKISAELKLKKKQNVALVTLDNYRVAATEQLKVYAGILDVPVYVCKNPGKTKNIFLDDNSDIFLIDTAGLSHKNNDLLMKQNDMLAGLDYDIEKHLVLSANYKPEDISEMIEAFSYLSFDRIVISKVDETNRFGHLVEEAEKWGRAFSFFSTGQKVPDDHIPADNRYLVDRILRGWKRV